MTLLYNIGIRLYQLVAWIISPWNRKARLWSRGRRGWREKIRQTFSPGDRVVWFHCASLGEFEQGRPVMEGLRDRCPHYKILLTFFSPSGYEKRKSYDGADQVMYLPVDTARNARLFVEAVAPEIVIFIKYEFWLHFLRRLRKQSIPVYLASGIFRPGQLFFRWYGSWYRKFLLHFTQIFVQQNASAELLENIGIGNVRIAGDTRFDRVKEVSESAYTHRALEAFASGQRLVVAGSTWDQDEQCLEAAFNELGHEVRWIIAPHELSDAHLQRLRKRFPDSVLFTELDREVPAGIRVVIINTIGQLSYLYRFGTLAYIGGGFGKGIHNILEAATYGIPVIFGPNHRKFSEALELSDLGGAFPVLDKTQLISTIRQHLTSESLLKSASATCRNYVSDRVGATKTILEDLCITG